MKDWLKHHGNLIGAVVAFTVGAAALYEGIAIVTVLPTWSRVFQGIRDASPLGQAAVVAIAAGVVYAARAFAKWVGPHLRKGRRSSL